MFLCSFFFYTLQTKDSFLVNKRRAKGTRYFGKKHCIAEMAPSLLLERREGPLSLSALVVNFGPESGPGIMLLCMDSIQSQLWFYGFSSFDSQILEIDVFFQSFSHSWRSVQFLLLWKQLKAKRKIVDFISLKSINSNAF